MARLTAGSRGSRGGTTRRSVAAPAAGATRAAGRWVEVAVAQARSRRADAPLQRADDRGVELRPGLAPDALVGHRSAAVASRYGRSDGHRLERVADGEDPGGERDLLARQARRGSRAVPALVVVEHDVDDRLGAARADRTTRAPVSGWLRMTTHSSSVSGPGLERIRSGTPILPTSCSRQPKTELLGLGDLAGRSGPRAEPRAGVTGAGGGS